MTESARLKAVQPELLACRSNEDLDRRRCKPPTCILISHPVAQPRALKRTAHDTCQIESTIESFAGKEAQRVSLAGLTRNETFSDVCRPPCVGEKLLGANWLPRREM